MARSRRLAGCLAAGLTMTAGHAGAIDLAPPVASGWQAEFGARAFFSGGRLQKDLYDPDVRRQMNSRLTYGGTTASTGELFGRVDAPSGWFVRGYAGIGSHAGGLLTDEDYPPDTVPYSKTHSSLRNGKIDYGSLDIGLTIWRAAGVRLGAFAGVHHFKEKYNGYGCLQVAAGNFCDVTIPFSVLTLSETSRWTSLRLGLVGDVMLTDRLKLTADAAVLPYSRLSAFDNHWMRPDINPMPENGQGYGFQVEASLSYKVTDAFSLGAGGRYWYHATTGAKTRFPGETNASHLDFRSERWGAFLQASYRTPF
jgi:hypothetical protein